MLFEFWIKDSPITCTSHGQYIAHPTDCHKYYQCLGQNPSEMTCPNNLAWNDAISACDYSENVQLCNEVADDTTNDEAADDTNETKGLFPFWYNVFTQMSLKPNFHTFILYVKWKESLRFWGFEYLLQSNIFSYFIKLKWWLKYRINYNHYRVQLWRKGWILCWPKGLY